MARESGFLGWKKRRNWKGPCVCIKCRCERPNFRNNPAPDGMAASWCGSPTMFRRARLKWKLQQVDCLIVLRGLLLPSFFCSSRGRGWSGRLGRRQGHGAQARSGECCVNLSKASAWVETTSISSSTVRQVTAALRLPSSLLRESACAVLPCLKRLAQKTSHPCGIAAEGLQCKSAQDRPINCFFCISAKARRVSGTNGVNRSQAHASSTAAWVELYVIQIPVTARLSSRQ